MRYLVKFLRKELMGNFSKSGLGLVLRWGRRIWGIWGIFLRWFDGFCGFYQGVEIGSRNSSLKNLQNYEIYNVIFEERRNGEFSEIAVEINF
jgi:hypothetical protein